MAKFVEFHRTSNGQPVLINFDHVASVQSFTSEKGTVSTQISFAVAVGEKRAIERVYVSDAYETVKTYLI